MAGDSGSGSGGGSAKPRATATATAKATATPAKDIDDPTRDAAALDRATVGRTVWMTEAQDAAIRAQMAREGRRSISDFLRALIARGLGLTGGGGGGGGGG